MKNRLILISVFYLNLLVFVFVVSFFFECPIYNMCRIEMEKNPMRIMYIPVTLNFLLNGSNTLTHEDNIHIFCKCTKAYFSNERSLLILNVCSSLQTLTVKHTHVYKCIHWDCVTWSFFFLFFSFSFLSSLLFVFSPFCLLSFSCILLSYTCFCIN